MEEERPLEYASPICMTPPGKVWVGVILGYPANTRVPHLWRAITPVMRAHGRLQRHVFSLESFFDDVYPRWHDGDRAMHEKLKSAFNGGTGFSLFHLYRWEGTGFVLARPPVKGEL